MAKPNKATQAKRNRELKKIDKRKQKEERREERKHIKSEQLPGEEGVDPDLIGIYPGPQIPRE